MKRKITTVALSGLVALNSIPTLSTVYAVENSKSNSSIENQDTKSTKVIYLEAGEGAENSGDGTEKSPYKNIRTALSNIKDGETLKLVGDVVYTKYETHTDKSALPLFINKNITIEGIDSSSSLSLRSPIQLGANVTFKNMRLEMPPQVSLEGGTGGEDSGLLGEIIPRAATIFVAGHQLTLDNIDTRLGTNSDQYDERPYISGGAFKNQNNDKIGSNAIINIINPNSETRISGIYAGDYWDDRTMDVEINLDGKLVDTTLYTGGVENTLDGDVVVNISGKSGSKKSNITNFDKTNHNGKLYVNLVDGYDTTALNLEDIDELTLEDGARVAPYGKNVDLKFDVGNVFIKSGSVIDLRDIKSSPIIRGNFSGVENSKDLDECGRLLLNNNQTLEIGGSVTGLTRLNYNNGGYVASFIDGHEYIRADINSTGNFSIEGTDYTEFELKINKNITNNTMSWTTIDSSDSISSIFKDFRWIEGSEKIIDPQVNDMYEYQIEFIDDNDNAYKPDIYELLDDFTYILEKPNGDTIDITDTDVFDFDIFAYFNDDKMNSSDIRDINQIELTFYNPSNLYGEIVLTVTHNDTNKQITKTIYVMESSKTLEGTVAITGDLVEGEVISADTSGLIGDCKELQYTWYINGIKVDGENSKKFVLTEEHVGKEVKVEVEAKNYVGSIFSEEFTVEESGTVIPPDVDEPDNGEEDTPDIDDPENGEENTPDVDEPENGEGDTPDVDDPENGEGDTPDVDEPEDGEGDTPDVDEPEDGKEDTPDVNEPEDGEENTPDVDEPDNGEENNPDVDEPEINVSVNKEGLKAYYDKCISAKYRESKFTTSSFNSYEKALKAAKRILNSDSVTQTQIDIALQDLKDAVNGLKRKGSSGSSSGGGSSSSSSSSSSNKDNSSEADHNNSNSEVENNEDKVITDIVDTNNQNSLQGESNGNSGQSEVNKSGWTFKDGKWYHQDESGTMTTGWHKDKSDGKWYHLGNSGAMTTGWYKDTNGKWYHLGNSGAMTTGWYKDTNGKWYHLGNSGTMTTGWYKDTNGKWYYLNSDGSMASNTTIDGFKIGADGAWIK